MQVTSIVKARQQGSNLEGEDAEIVVCYESTAAEVDYVVFDQLLCLVTQHNDECRRILPTVKAIQIVFGEHHNTKIVFADSNE